MTCRQACMTKCSHPGAGYTRLPIWFNEVSEALLPLQGRNLIARLFIKTPLQTKHKWSKSSSCTNAQDKGAADLEKALYTSTQEIFAVSTVAPEMSSQLLTQTAKDLIMILFTIQIFSLVQLKEQKVQLWNLSRFTCCFSLWCLTSLISFEKKKQQLKYKLKSSMCVDKQ